MSDISERLENEINEAKILMHTACTLISAKLPPDLKAVHLYLLGSYFEKRFSREYFMSQTEAENLEIGSSWKPSRMESSDSDELIFRPVSQED